MRFSTAASRPCSGMVPALAGPRPQDQERNKSFSHGSHPSRLPLALNMRRYEGCGPDGCACACMHVCAFVLPDTAWRSELIHGLRHLVKAM
eukprot:351491-Chlamydomonas_euryale.AAC.5